MSLRMQLFRTDLVNTAKAALTIPEKNRYGNIFACEWYSLYNLDWPCIYTHNVSTGATEVSLCSQMTMRAW